jgi:hypothetical protein
MGISNLYKNGSSIGNAYRTIIFQKSAIFNMDRIGVHGSVILSLSAGDYIELFESSLNAHTPGRPLQESYKIYRDTNRDKINNRRRDRRLIKKTTNQLPKI